MTERSIYRDIRTLENAGVPMGSEAGIGYFLEQGYHLPPVSFTLDEAASIRVGEKLLAAGLDPDIAVQYAGEAFPKESQSGLHDAETGTASSDPCLRKCRGARVRRQEVEICYSTSTSRETSSR